MAAAAARAAIMARQRLKNKDKLLGQKAEVDRLDASSRKNLLAALRDSDDLGWLANVSEGKSINYKVEFGDIEPQSIQLDKQQKPVDSNEKPKLPSSRPSFLSERHYAFLCRVNHFQPAWFEAYIGYEPTLSQTKVAPMATAVQVANDAADESTVGAHLGKSGIDESVTLSRTAHYFNEFVLSNQVVVASRPFNDVVVAAIIVAGILVGVESYPSMSSNAALLFLENVVQVIFTIDCALKIFQEGRRPWVYWTGLNRNWNNFDFWLVSVCWYPFDGNVGFLRLLRLARLLKLVGKVKQLQVIVQGLIQGLGSVTYILLLLLLIFYLFAVLGVSTFRKNDPFHFGSIGIAMVTLFRMGTLESWTTELYINSYGCDSQFNGVVGTYHGAGADLPFYPGELGERNLYISTSFGNFPENECWKPSKQPVVSTIFFVLFVLIAAYVMLSLFIGAVCGGMADAMDAFKANEDKERSAKEALLAKEAAREAGESENGYSVNALRDAFETCDEDGSGEIDEEELVIAMKNMGEETATVEDARAMIATVDKDGDGTLGFREFVLLMSDGEIDVDKRKEELEHDTSPEELKKKSADIVAAVNLVDCIRKAWSLDEEDIKEAEALAKKFPILQKYKLLTAQAEWLAEYKPFVNFMTLTICLAGALVGIQTELVVPGEPQDYPVIDAMDNFVLAVFTLEIVVKVVAQGTRPLRFFRENWNKFDFFIVFACFFFMIPVFPNVSSMLSMLRLLRLLRVLKLVKALPELRIIIEALISGFGSITFVTIILCIFFYIYANIGMLIFAENDPANFGNLQLAMVALFRSATLDGWSDIMYTNLYGCDRWSYVYGRAYETKQLYKSTHSNCNHPQAFGWVAIVYMISFVVLGAQVLMTLFIGIVATSMEEAKAAGKEDAKHDIRLKQRQRALGIDNRSLDLYAVIFKELDRNNEKKLGREAIKPLVRSLPLLRNTKAMLSSGKKLSRKSVVDLGAVLAAADSPRLLSRKDVDKLITVIDDNYSGTVEFAEFIVLMEFLRKADSDPATLVRLRDAFNNAKPKKGRAAARAKNSVEDRSGSVAVDVAKTSVNEGNARDGSGIRRGSTNAAGVKLANQLAAGGSKWMSMDKPKGPIMSLMNVMVTYRDDATAIEEACVTLQKKLLARITELNQQASYSDSESLAKLRNKLVVLSNIEGLFSELASASPRTQKSSHETSFREADSANATPGSSVQNSPYNHNTTTFQISVTNLEELSDQRN